MSRNGSGTYNLAAGQPVVTGTTISSTTFNTQMTDFATALTGSVAADGQTPITGALKAVNGSNAAASYSFTASLGTGLYSPTTNQAAIAAGGVQVVNFISTGATTALPITSTLATGTAPFVVASSTQVANLNAQYFGGLTTSQISSLTTAQVALLANSNTFAALTTQSVAALTASGQITSTLASGTAPLAVTSTTQVSNLNAQYHGGLTTSQIAVLGTAQVQALSVTEASALKSATTSVSVSAATAPSSGQILTATGASTATWQTPAGGATWVYLSTVTAANSATVDVETTFSSTYDMYVIVANYVLPSTDATNLRIQMKLGGAYAAIAYIYHVANPVGSAATYAAVSSGGDTSINSGATIGSGAGYGAEFVMYIANPASTTQYKKLFFTGNATTTAGATYSLGGSAWATAATTALTGIRFFMSSGNIASGSFRLYGIKTS